MKKLLIIEDDKLQATAFLKTFSSQYTLTIAGDGSTGLTKAIEWLPDLIILDIILPGMWTGLDTLRELKKNPQTKSIPVIILTNLDREQEEMAKKEGAAEYLLKTETSLEELEAKIHQYMQAI